MNCSITKSGGDAKVELFPGARPPDTTFNELIRLHPSACIAKNKEIKLKDYIVSTHLVGWGCRKHRENPNFADL